MHPRCTLPWDAWRRAPTCVHTARRAPCPPARAAVVLQRCSSMFEQVSPELHLVLGSLQTKLPFRGVSTRTPSRFGLRRRPASRKKNPFAVDGWAWGPSPAFTPCATPGRASALARPRPRGPRHAAWCPPTQLDGSKSALFIFSPQHDTCAALATGTCSPWTSCAGPPAPLPPDCRASMRASPALGGKGRRRGHALLYTQVMETLAANGDGQAEARRATHFRQRWRLSMGSLIRS